MAGFSGRRAQTLMAVLAAVSLVSSGFVMVGRHVRLLYSASKMYVAILIVCAIATMAAMYAMMTHQMWVRVRHLRTIGTGSSPSGGATSTVTASTTTHARAPAALNAVALKSQRQTAKGMRVLLVITIVFVVCWSPLGVATCGVRVPSACSICSSSTLSSTHSSTASCPATSGGTCTSSSGGRGRCSRHASRSEFA